MEAKGGFGAPRPRSGPSVTWLSSVLLFASAAGIIVTTVKGCRGADVLTVLILQRKPALEALSYVPKFLISTTMWLEGRTLLKFLPVDVIAVRMLMTEGSEGQARLCWVEVWLAD